MAFLRVYLCTLTKNIIQFSNHLRGRRKKISISFTFNENPSKVINISTAETKILTAFFANQIHYIDATIALLVLEKLQAQKIIAYSNHDAFFVSPKHFKILRKIYSQVFMKILSDPKSFFETFFKCNNITFNIDELNNFFNEVDFSLEDMKDSEHFLS